MPKARRTDRTDYGPRQRLVNGTAVLTYRADPEAPSAPAIRAARAFVRWEAMDLPEPSYQAARRIEEAAAARLGAYYREGNNVRSSAYWERGGPTMKMLDGAEVLRDVHQVLGRRMERAVLLLVVDGDGSEAAAARIGLATMAEFWRL